MFGRACGSAACFLLHADHGCDRHPAFPAPSRYRGCVNDGQLGQIMSRELGCLTHRSCNALNVVPAKAGTYNHRRLSLKDGGTTSPVHYTGRGV